MSAKLHVLCSTREKATRGVSPFLAWGDFHARLRFASLRADEIKLWLTPSAKQRLNPCSGLPAVYPDLSTRHDWPVKKGLCFVCRDRQSG